MTVRWKVRTALLAVVAAATIGAFAPQASAATMEPNGAYATSAEWDNGPYGQTLSIEPTYLAGLIGTAAASGVWNDALSMAGAPPYSAEVYASLYEQLQCHLFYGFKTPYHLDTWRPSVPWWLELWDLCNPT